MTITTTNKSFAVFVSARRKKRLRTHGPTDGPTDRHGDGPSVPLYLFLAKWLIELRVRDLWRSALLFQDAQETLKRFIFVDLFNDAKYYLISHFVFR